MQPYYGILDTQTLCYSDTADTETVQEEKRCEPRALHGSQNELRPKGKYCKANLVLLMVEDKNESSWSQK